MIQFMNRIQAPVSERRVRSQLGIYLPTYMVTTSPRPYPNFPGEGG